MSDNSLAGVWVKISRYIPSGGRPMQMAAARGVTILFDIAHDAQGGNVLAERRKQGRLAGGRAISGAA